MKKLVSCSFLLFFVMASALSQERKTTEKSEEAPVYEKSSKEAKNPKEEEEKESMEDWIGALRLAMEGEETPNRKKEDGVAAKTDSFVSDPGESETDNFAIDVSVPNQNKEDADYSRVLKRLDRIETLLEKTLQKTMEAAQRAGNAEALAKSNRKVLNQLIKLNGARISTGSAVQTGVEEGNDEEKYLPDTTAAEHKEASERETSEADHFAIDISTDEPGEKPRPTSGESLNSSDEGQGVLVSTPEVEETASAPSTIKEEEMPSIDQKTDRGMAKKVEDAIQAIRDTGKQWVKALQSGSSETAVNEAENRFHSAAGEALTIYREAAGSNEEVDLLKALTDIHTAISEAQNKANKVRQQEQ